MKRFLPAITAMMLISANFPVLAQDPPPPPGQSSRQPHAFPKPTNLQVLPKDISPDDLRKLMGNYSRSLGVHCNFCHEVNEQTHQPNFAADTKPDKAIARTMIAMTKEINQKYLSTVNDPDATPEMKTVTCGTCHRGNTMPEPFKPRPEEHHPGGAPSQKPQ